MCRLPGGGTCWCHSCADTGSRAPRRRQNPGEADAVDGERAEGAGGREEDEGHLCAAAAVGEDLEERDEEAAQLA